MTSWWHIFIRTYSPPVFLPFPWLISFRASLFSWTQTHHHHPETRKTIYFFLSQKQKWTTICTWSDTTLTVYTAYVQPHHPGRFYKCKAWNQNKARVSDWLNYDSKVKTMSPVCYSNIFRVRWLWCCCFTVSAFTELQCSTNLCDWVWIHWVTVVYASGCICLILVTSVSVNA